MESLSSQFPLRSKPPQKESSLPSHQLIHGQSLIQEQGKLQSQIVHQGLKSSHATYQEQLDQGFLRHYDACTHSHQSYEPTMQRLPKEFNASLSPPQFPRNQLFSRPAASNEPAGHVQSSQSSQKEWKVFSRHDATEKAVVGVEEKTEKGKSKKVENNTLLEVFAEDTMRAGIKSEKKIMRQRPFAATVEEEYQVIAKSQHTEKDNANIMEVRGRKRRLEEEKEDNDVCQDPESTWGKQKKHLVTAGRRRGGSLGAAEFLLTFPSHPHSNLIPEIPEVPMLSDDYIRMATTAEMKQLYSSLSPEDAHILRARRRKILNRIYSTSSRNKTREQVKLSKSAMYSWRQGKQEVQSVLEKEGVAEHVVTHVLAIIDRVFQTESEGGGGESDNGGERGLQEHEEEYKKSD